MTHAVLYVRAHNTDSIDTQKRILATFCQAEGLEVVAEFADTGLPASGLASAIQAAKEGPDAALVVCDPTRLGRDLDAVVRLAAEVTVVTVASR